jgi:hypothetical protein
MTAEVYWFSDKWSFQACLTEWWRREVNRGAADEYGSEERQLKKEV